MKTQQISNSARAFILVIAIVLLTIVSVKADMVKATYSPYKCTMESTKEEKEQSSVSMNVSYLPLTDLYMRKFNFVNHPEAKKIKEEVRRYDVTSSKSKMILEVKITGCEYPLYKII